MLMQRIHSAVVRHKALAAIVFALLVAFILLYARQIASIITVAILLVLASFSTVYKRKMGMPLGGIELVTFGTVITAVAFNPVVGLLFGVVSSLASSIISQDIGPLTWIYVFSAGLVGLLAGYFSYLNIVFIGVAATVMLLLINQLIYLFIGDADIKSMTAFYIATNLISNIILFATVGSRVLSLLAN